ncbi:MAG: hypothetical protein ACREC5_05065, partial [Thermoplasmata archaeon]
ALAAAQLAGAPSELRGRNAERTNALAREFGSEIGRRTGPPAEILVHATLSGSPGAPELELPLDGLIGPESYVFDLVCSPTHRFLESEARQRGARYEDGRDLLVLQAAGSFARWWGRPVPPEEIRATREALA